MSFVFAVKKYGFSLVIGKFPARNRAARCAAPTGRNIFLTAGDRKGRPYVFSRAYFETLGGRVTDPPLRRIQKPSVFNVGAGPRPARRCTRRVQEAAPYRVQRPPRAATWVRPYKVGGNLPPHPPRIRSAPSPQGEGFRAVDSCPFFS